MTATYDDAQIYSSSRITYDGGADDTVGAGAAPRATTKAARPTATASAARPRATATAPR